MKPSSFLGAPITRDYRPGLVGASSRTYDHRGVLTWGDVEAMKRDPQIAFGLRILYAPLPQVKWKVKAKDKAVAQYVDRIVRKVWTNHLPDLLDCLCYGHSGGEVIWKHDEQTDLIEFDRIDPVMSPDLRPLQCGRDLAGVAVQGLPEGDGGPGWIQAPRALWVVNEQIPGSLYGRSRLRSAWFPWQEKTGRHGALDVRRLWFVKNVFRGGIIRHPAGTIETAPGVWQSCQDYARELVEKMEAGGVLTLPNLTDENGNQLWTYEEPKVNGDLTGVRDYTGDLDLETLTALGIPPEVVQAADTGSGWSGRSVPFLVWLSSEDLIVASVIRAVVEQIARPGVCVNFGEQWFEVEPESLVPKGMTDDAAQTEGSQEQGQEQAQGDGEDLLGTVGGLQAIVAVQQSVYSGQLPREAGVALAKEVMGLDGESAERLFPLALEEQQQQPAPQPAPAPVAMSLDQVQMAQDAAEPQQPAQLWVRYEGKRGGRGWRNTQTGRIVYGESKPTLRGNLRKGATKAALPHERPVAADVAAKVKGLRESGQASAEDIQDLAHQLMSLRVVDLQEIKKEHGVRSGKLKAELVAKIKAFVETRPQPEPEPEDTNEPAEPAAEPGRAGDGRTGSPDAGNGGPVAETPGGSAGEGADQSGDAGRELTGTATARRVPAETAEVNRRLDRFEKLFKAKGQHQVAEWLGKLREHVNAVGAESALAALNPDSEGLGKKGDEVQYWGVGTEEANWKNMGSFIESYLSRNGIVTVTGDTSDPNLPLVSALGAPDKYVAGDFKPAGMHYTDKLTEAKDLPGLETSEDISKIMGKEVTHLTQEVTSKLDERYGKGQWIVKCYDDNAAAGYGIFFPQRAAAIAEDAKNTIWNAGAALSKYGFQLARDPETKKVVGLVHETGDTYAFGSEEYQKTIDGDARQWADRAAAAAQHEQGAMLPEGSFMAQPAFKAVGISDAERAAGKTWHEKNEGRVHLVTRPDGNVEVIPHSTWLKGGNLPVVFEDDDTRAMAEAARDAISKLPPEARKGQVYAPDIMKTADGYRVVELNAQGDNNGSGYLHDNHFTIDAYTSYLTGRQPAHVQFIRSLLTKKVKEDKPEGDKGKKNADGNGLHPEKIKHILENGASEDMHLKAADLNALIAAVRAERKG